MSYILEVCVDSVESAIAAKKGGANRLELCSNLVIGGTSPSIELFHTINKYIDIKSNILIRPRFGDFCYSEFEYEVIKKEITLFKEAGANGVVIGILKEDGFLDTERMNELVSIAESMDITLHRCFDVSKDAYKTLEDVEKLGISSILTSGQKNNAIDGLDLLNDLQSKTNKVNIMVGSGVNLNVVKTFLQKTNLKTFHLSGKKTLDSKMKYRNADISMGLPIMSEFDIWETDENKIREVKNLLDKQNSK